MTIKLELFDNFRYPIQWGFRAILFLFLSQIAYFSVVYYFNVTTKNKLKIVIIYWQFGASYMLNDPPIKLQVIEHRTGLKKN